MFIAGVSGEPDRWLKLMLLRLATLLRLFSGSLLSPSVFICRWPLALLLQPPAIPKFPSSPRQPKATLFPPIWPPSGPQETCSARQVQGSSPLSGSFPMSLVSPAVILQLLQSQAHPQRLQLSLKSWVPQTARGALSVPTEASFPGSWGQRVPKEPGAWPQLSTRKHLYLFPSSDSLISLAWLRGQEL